MAEGSRCVAFNEEMTVPRKAVSEERSKEQQPPSYCNCSNKKQCCKSGRTEMPSPSWCLCVLVDIEGPKLFKTPKMHFVNTLFSHGQSVCSWRLSIHRRNPNSATCSKICSKHGHSSNTATLRLRQGTIVVLIIGSLRRSSSSLGRISRRLVSWRFCSKASRWRQGIYARVYTRNLWLRVVGVRAVEL